MMNRKILFLIVIIALLSGCKIKNAESTENVEVEESFILPEGAFPMTYYRNHIYIDGKIDSIDGRLVFDTGADGLYFDSTYYADASFPDSKTYKTKMEGAGTGSQSVIALHDIFNFSFDDYLYKTVGTYVIKLKPILGDFADGMIGQVYFSNQKYLMEINFVHEYIVLHSDTTTIELSAYNKIDMKKQTQSRRSFEIGGEKTTEYFSRFFVPITIQINDSLRIHEDFLLDIGSGGSIDITTAIAKKYNLPSLINDKIQRYDKYGGIGGHSSNFYFNAKSIEIGGFKLDDIIMRYSEDKKGALADRQFSAGLLGNLIMERFDVVIDFGDSTALYLKPNQNYENPFEFSKRGFSYSNRKETLNAWIVTGFYKDSPAEKSGLQIDDRIISINGMNICEISYQEEENIWEQLDKIELTVLRNGEEMRFDFELWNFQLNK